MKAHEIVKQAADLAMSLPREAARRQELWDLNGEMDDTPAPYDYAEGLLTKAIERLQEALQEVRYFRNHRHKWSEDDYCSICRADGRF